MWVLDLLGEPQASHQVVLRLLELGTPQVYDPYPAIDLGQQSSVVVRLTQPYDLLEPAYGPVPLPPDLQDIPFQK